MRKKKSLPLVPKGRWQAEGLSEGIRTGGDRRLTTPQSRYASQLPFTGEPLDAAPSQASPQGEPLVRWKFVGVDVRIDPRRASGLAEAAA